MENLTPELLQLSPIVILSIFAIREFFAFLKSKKTNGHYPTITECELKHGYLNQNIIDIKDSIEKIQINHLAHIEPDIQKMKIDIAKIMVILEERLPSKK